MNEINQRVAEVTFGLSRLSREGFDVSDLAKIWVLIPSGDPSDGKDYFHNAFQSIQAVSILVDNQFPQLSRGARTAKKLRLMAGLLELKATQVENLP